jgi:Predicted signal transduction protein with a C-terminal ATPase domain
MRMLFKIKQKYKNMRIRNKLSIVFITLIVVFIALILIISDTILYNSSIAKTKQNISDEINLIGNHLDTMSANLVTCSNIAANDINRIYNGTAKNKTNRISFVSIKNNLFTAMDYDRRCFPEISSIIFVDVNGNLVYDGLEASPDVSKISADLISKMAESGPPLTVTFPMQPRPYFADGGSEGIMTAGKRIISMQTGENIGYLFINVKESTISSIFPDGSGGQYYIINPAGVVVSSLDKGLLQKPVPGDDLRKKLLNRRNDSFQASAGGDEYLLTSQPMPEFQWTLVHQISIRSLTKDIQMTSTIIIVIGFLCILSAVLLIFILSGWITKPIQRLTKAARKIQSGDFDAYCDVLSEDEIGTLSGVFNEMAEKIGELLDRVKSEQKKKREYELAMIQEQIKPHFLYNSLDLIYVLCAAGNPEEGAKTTKVLADYYRTSLNNGNELISIREELKNIENYLYIQKERYSDLIDFKISVDPQLNTFFVPKMILQPLVENSIYHGLKEKGNKGCITILGRMEEGFILLEVSDDGIGMDEEQLRSLSQNGEKGSRRHFGLHSVQERILLYFGEECGLSVSSEKNKGTKVTVKIPKRMNWIYD